MSELPPNIQTFNLVVGYVFAQLYKVFPQRVHVDLEHICQAMNVEYGEYDSAFGEYIETGETEDGINLGTFIAETLAWLEKENFVSLKISEAGHQYTLTREALSIMNKTPAGVERDKTHGSQIAEAAKGAGKATGNAALGDLVGQVIGGISKSFMS